ncbi:MAG: Calx-beta domain-containing protein [Vicinamibacterales bacterium]
MRHATWRRLMVTAATLATLTAGGESRQASPTFVIEDVTVAEGTGGTAMATFRVVLRSPNLVESRVHVVTADGSATAAAATFSTAGGLTLPAFGAATPYPATIDVSGLTGTIQHLAVRLDQFTHTFPADLDMLLVGPQGQRAMFMSDIGTSVDVANLTLTFMDGAPTPGATLASGTFAPDDNSPGDVMPGPAPIGPYGSALATFVGTDPNGTWQIFVNDDQNPDGGTLGGVSLVITTTGNGGDYVPTAGLLTFPPGTPARTIQVPIKTDGVVEGDETVTANLLGGFNAVIGDGTAVGTILDDDGVTTTQPPTGLSVSAMAGNVVTFRWNAPLVGPAPTGFLFSGGTTPGGVLATIPVGTSPTLTIGAPPGSFYARVQTVSATGASPPSNEILFHVGVPVAPSAPADLVGVEATSRLALAWRNTFTGGAPTTLVLDVTGTLNAALPLGATDAFTFNGVPNGTYTFTVRAVNAAGSSAPSNPVTLTFPGACGGVLQPPANFTASRSGNVVHLWWDAPDLGPAPTGYAINAFFGNGAFIGTIPLPGKSFSTPVPPGTYLLSVNASNYCGNGLATPLQAVTVP